MAPNMISNRTIRWNEEIHTFEPIGTNRFVHYVRKVYEHNTADDRPGEPRFLTGAEVERWIEEHNPPPLDDDDLRKLREEADKRQYGPDDNPMENTDDLVS